MRGKAWAVLPVCVAALCVVAGVYILMYERQRCQDGAVMATATTMQLQPPASPPPSLPAYPPVPTPQPPAPKTRLSTTVFTPHHHQHLGHVPAPRVATVKGQEEELVAPAAQVRAPLVVSHKLEYMMRHRKYTFQSDQRDQLMYPTPAFYRLKLLVPLRNVVAIALSSGVFPITEYNVNPYNQWLDLDVGGTVYSIQLPQGEYTDSTLAPALQAAITGYGAPLNTFTVAFDPLTRRITVANAAPFSLLFRTGPHVNTSLWQVIGFPQLDTVTGASVTAPGVIDLAGALAIDMFIDEVSTNIDSTDNAVARISLQKFTPVSALTYFTPTNYGVLRKFWPIGRLQYLTFRFMVKVSELQPDGQVVIKYRPYEFNERNHTMQLTMTCKEYESPQDEFVELDPQS